MRYLLTGIGAFFDYELNPRYEAIFNPDNIDHDCEELVKILVAR